MQTGEASRAVSRSHPGWQQEFRETLPDLTEDDICGSGFAMTGYMASKALGGAAALADIRGRLAKRGLKLMLDQSRFAAADGGCFFESRGSSQ